MATTESRIDCGDYWQVETVITDDTTGAVLGRASGMEWKPGTPEANRAANLATMRDLIDPVSAIGSGDSGYDEATQRMVLGRALACLLRDATGDAAIAE